MRLSAHDASFLYTETASGQTHGVGISVLDDSPTYQEICDYCTARTHLISSLRQRLAFAPFNLAHPKWVDDPDFDLANHLKAHVVVQRATEIALELGEPLLDRSRPLWLTYVIENVEGRTLLVQLTHHSFVDGATSVARSPVLTDPEPDASPPQPPETPWKPAPMPGAFELWQEAVAENARKSADQAARMFRESSELASLTQQASSLVERLVKPVMVAPWNASLIGPKRKIATRD
jgi:hypothetical protein